MCVGLVVGGFDGVNVGTAEGALDGGSEVGERLSFVVGAMVVGAKLFGLDVPVFLYGYGSCFAHVGPVQSASHRHDLVLFVPTTFSIPWPLHSFDSVGARVVGACEMGTAVVGG